jgi:hypothetical protein
MSSELRAFNWVRFLVPLALVLLSATEAHAQRVPEEVLWSASAALFAPFVAVPVKLGMLRLLSLEAGAGRLWSLSAIEWLLWFPLAFLLLRSGGWYSVPLVPVGLLIAAVWIHSARVAHTTWKSALLLALATPVLALALPFLALVSVAYLESLAA